MKIRILVYFTFLLVSTLTKPHSSPKKNHSSKADWSGSQLPQRQSQPLSHQKRLKKKKYNKSTIKISFIAIPSLKDHLKENFKAIKAEDKQTIEMGENTQQLPTFSKDEKAIKAMVEATTNEMMMFTIEVDNVFGEKYFYMYEPKYKADGKLLAYLAAGKQLILADSNKIHKKALWITSVQMVVPKGWLSGDPYLRFNYEEIAPDKSRSELQKLDRFFAYTSVLEKQKFMMKGSKKEREQTYTLYSYKYCPECKFIGFRDTDDIAEREFGPYLGISKLFWPASEVKAFKIQDKMIKQNNEESQYGYFTIILKEKVTGFLGSDKKYLGAKDEEQKNINARFFEFEVDQEQPKWEKDHYLMLNYEFEVKVKILKLHFHNFYFFNNQKFHNTAVRENLQKYQKAYFGYETASDGYKLYLEESKNLDIFDEEKLKGQGKSVANLKYKVLFNSGIKLMDYITEKRTVLLYENFKLSEPRNADSSEFYPKLFKPDESFTEAWLVPFMFPFVRFSYPVESSFWDFFSSEVKAKTGDLDFLLLENNSGANKIDIVKKEINNEEESKDIQSFLGQKELMTPLKNGRNENNRLKDLIFDRGQCYSFHDKKRGIKVEQRMTRINGKYHATVDLESDEMKSYDKSNTVFSMEYNLDYLPIEIWQHSPDDGDKVKYCILKREFQYTAQRPTGCKYVMASPEEQNTIQIDSDHKEDCFKQTVIQKYTKEGKKEAMQRVNDCNILKDLKESGTINWYSFTVNTNDNKYEFYKYGDDDFQIYDSNNNQVCFTIDSLQKIQFDYEKEGSKRMNAKKNSKVNPKSKKNDTTSHQNIKMMKNTKNVKSVVNKQKQSKLRRFRKIRRTQRK